MLTVKVLMKQCREGDRIVKQAWPSKPQLKREKNNWSHLVLLSHFL